jgi:hypothetical protein
VSISPARPTPVLAPRSALLALAGLAGLLGLLGPVGPTASYADHADPPGPVNAQSTFLWGRPAWQDDWESAERGPYRVSGPGTVRTQHGMLTLNTTNDGTVTATRRGQGYATGRWEIRLRSRGFDTGATDFTVRTELVPAGKRDQHCGALDIALESYRIGDDHADFWIRTLPASQFTTAQELALVDDAWHTFAVEVTPSRISWFVDAHVVRTERRRAALSGVPLTARFSMLAEPGKQMNPSRMQMDWLRYFTLQRPNALPVDAPRTTRGTYDAAC